MRVLNCLALVSLAGIAGLALTTTADGNQPAGAPITTSGSSIVRSSNPAKDNLSRMQKVITVEFDGIRFEDTIKNIGEQTGVDLEVLYKNDRGEGLDPEAQIKLIEKNSTALVILTKLLSKAAPDEKDEATWQFTSDGKMQVGRKFDLNKFRRVEIYSIRDLLLQLPLYPDVPEVNLQQALQSSGGGGGGQSPFTQNGGQRQRDPRQIEEERQRRSQDLITLLTLYAEPTQWISGGGDLQNPRYFDGNIIVDAPDYMHRALVGYPWWPSAKSSAPAGTRRFASISLDTAIASVPTFRNVPVTAAVGGQLIQSGGPGGGG